MILFIVMIEVVMRPSKYNSAEERMNARKEQYKKYNSKRTTITTTITIDDNHNNHNNSDRIKELEKELEDTISYYQREIKKLKRIIAEYEGDE